jgi:hypothetical protein
MSKASPIYTTFASGQLSPYLGGRTDLQQYFNGGQTMLNWLALFYGPMLRRPGSVFSKETKTSAKVSRLLEFVFSNVDAYIIEFGHEYFRFFTNSGIVLSGASPYEVAHTYQDTELFDVHYVQKQDVISLLHPSHAPAKLTRAAAASWSLAAYVFKGTPYLPDNTTATTIASSGTTGTVTLTASASIFQAGHVGTFWKIGAPTGTPEAQGFVKIATVVSGTEATAEVQSTLAGTGATDNWAEGAWSSVRGWPSRAAYHDGRLWFARTTTQPNGVWGSKPFIYENFDPGTGADDDAISTEINAERAIDIKWITTGKGLSIGTSEGEAVLSSGSTSTPITPSNFTVDWPSSFGSEAIQPRRIGNYAYFVQAKARKLREFFYFWDLDTYKAVDVTAYSDDITEGKVKDMTYQKDPYSILYCVLEDGTIAAMSREIDQQALAWTPITTDNGLYESVGSIPMSGGAHDQVWCIVNRTIGGATKRYIEYFTSPVIPDIQSDCIYLDSSLSYNAFDQTTGLTLTLSAKTGTVTATASGAHFNTDDVGQRIRALDGDTILGEMLITGYTSSTVVTGVVTKEFTATSYGVSEWGVSVTTISGLSHLESEEVDVLADGGVEPPATVESSQITLSHDGFIVHVGLGYTSRYRNMPIEAGSATGTAQGKRKRIYQIGLRVLKTLGLRVGRDETALTQVTFREPSTLLGLPEALFTGTKNNIPLNTRFDYDGQFTLEQSEPLPACVLAIFPLVETEDR